MTSTWKVRLSQSNNELHNFPLKLFSVSLDELPEGSDVFDASRASLNDYIMNAPLLKLWGYPLPLLPAGADTRDQESVALDNLSSKEENLTLSIAVAEAVPSSESVSLPEVGLN